MAKTVTLQITDKEKATIHKEIYGHFSEHLGRCIYEGIYVGEDSPVPNQNGMRSDVVEALKDIGVPVLRWPGGCFADEYHWKDGIGAKETRKKMINTNWGGLVEDNRFGTHEFFELCRQLDCEPYLAGNLGSGTVQELAEWIEYITFDGSSPMTELRCANGQEKPWRLKYLGIGNESWGCGGNMRPEYYCDLYRQYQSFCKDFSGNKLYKVACGPNADDYHWTEVIMQNLNVWQTRAISLHYYTVPGGWDDKCPATGFTEKQYYETIKETLRMEEILDRHLEIMDKFDGNHDIGMIVDEWGTWYQVEEGTNPGFLYQQNTMRDAIVAAINLNIFNQRADRVVMANLAQVVNVLQAVILTEGMNMVKTPTYHVFRMYKAHQGATLLQTHMDDVRGEKEGYDIPWLSHSVSKASDGSILATVSNASLDEEITIYIEGIPSDKEAKVQILTGNMGDYNDFAHGERVEPSVFDGCVKSGDGWKLTLPPCSVAALKFC